MHPKKILPHNPGWSLAYEAKATRLSEAFGDALQGMHHIGGTSVPGLVTKPVIDVLVVLTSFIDEASWSDRMSSLGYEVRGEYGISGRRYFSRKLAGHDVAGYHVHAYEFGSFHISRHIAFRDYLRLHPDVARDYGELKRSIADGSGCLPDDYPSRKSAFVQRIERKALAHFGYCDT